MKPEWIALGKQNGHAFLLSTKVGPIFCETRSDAEALKRRHDNAIGIEEVYDLTTDQLVHPTRLRLAK